MGRLEGKVAIVTGAARGVGAAVAQRFAAEGAKVVLADVLEEEGKETAREIGGDARFAHLDVTDEDQWRGLVDETAARWGRIDVLVNNAAVLAFKALIDFEKAEFERVIDVNLVGVFLGIKSVAPHMIARGAGSIVNIASVDGMKSANSLSAYSASKWGVRGLMRAAALELGPKGVRVNSVHPGTIDTKMMNPTGKPREALRANTGHVPLQRPGAPEEVASVCVFFASDEASYVSGSETTVDGGAIAGVYHRFLPGAPES
ncbi:SDR family NAD(P)-dependent oxidoreductase [Sphingosinicella terrae]|uniref:SDR family NAD(P)-dependent oxidoreductase n=1 Tax=Sphingosinicella terrae TaxID=2172047 RepID=UPI000E0DB13F|nr:glucose 1-dehydrogenase [Sphingosinicella terrae]